VKPPAGTVEGVAVKLPTMTKGLTVTVTVALADPPGPEAVIVYVVVVAGVTLTDPLAGCAPTPLSMVTLVAFAVVQLNVELLPAGTLPGVAVKLLTVGNGLTVTVTVDVAVPPGPVAVSV